MGQWVKVRAHKPTGYLIRSALCTHKDDRMRESCRQLGRDLKIAIMTILSPENGIREKATDAFRVVSSYNESTPYLDVLQVLGYLPGN